jgi:prevent-host-death family protein
MKNNNQISASEFKKHFLRLVDEVKNKHSSFVITKRGTPVARLVPLGNDKTKEAKSFFGFMKGAVKIKDDIVNFSSELDWEASHV